MKLPVLFAGLAVLLCSCSGQQEAKYAGEKTDTKADEIINKAIESHGGPAYHTAQIGFDFRGKHYTVRRSANRYVYTREWTDSTGTVQDILENSSQLTRLINGDTVQLSSKDASKYANSVNSVLYFALLPAGLHDSAVNKKYLGEVTVKNKRYHKVEATFDRQGGGKDHEDIYVYWIAADTYLIDYLAYAYHTDDKGVRFREAFNRQRIGGILFQNYINYSPANSTASVYQQDELFEKGLLKELSRIENLNISVLD